jgi:Phage integrase family
MIGLDARLYGTHSLRRTKATLIYKKTGNLRAVQLLLGHTKIESTVRYLGIEVDDALAVAEQIDTGLEARQRQGACARVERVEKRPHDQQQAQVTRGRLVLTLT